MPSIPNRIAQGISEKFATERNTFKHAVKDNPKDKIELEIGDSKQDDFFPQAKIMRWGNEVNFSLRRTKQDKNPKLRTAGDKVIYEDDDEDVVFYEKPEIGEDGGLEVELHLKKKPDTNVFNFSLETKELDFFYQPELTQEEIDNGAHRPENVIGSYAVYHQTKGGMNRADGQEYKTGKAFHIYRPHVTDKKGASTWADLHIEDGILSVTVPQDFLDSATYPVRVDPTFGYTSQGATGYSDPNNSYRGGQYNLPEAGTVNQISVYFNKYGTGATKIATAIYSSSEVLQAYSNEITSNPATGRVDFTISSSLDAGDYDLLAWNNGNGFTAGHRIYYDTSGGHEVYLSGQTYTTNGWQASFTSTSENSTNIKNSIYATYTASASSSITSVNGVAQADIASIAGISNANMAKFNGVANT